MDETQTLPDRRPPTPYRKHGGETDEQKDFANAERHRDQTTDQPIRKPQK